MYAVVLFLNFSSFCHVIRLFSRKNVKKYLYHYQYAYLLQGDAFYGCALWRDVSLFDEFFVQPRVRAFWNFLMPGRFGIQIDWTLNYFHVRM